MPDANDPMPSLPVSKTGRNLAIGLVLAVSVAGVALLAARLTGPSRPAPKLHRAVATRCGPSVRTRERDPSLDGCKGDAECRNGSNGHCERNMVAHAHFENRCIYDRCSTDDDCKKREEDPLSTGPCTCGEKGEVNACLAGNCRTDADCGSSGFCSPSRDFECGYEGSSGYYCHTRDDQCVNDSDCAIDGGKQSAQCRYDPNANRWACASTECRRY